MATQTVEFSYTTGQTLVLKLFALGSDDIIVTSNATEYTNQKSIYHAQFEDIPSGSYRAIIFRDGVGVANGYVKLILGSGTFNIKSDAEEREVQAKLVSINLEEYGIEWWITVDRLGDDILSSGVTDDNGYAKALLVPGNYYYMWARKARYDDLLGQKFMAPIE